MVWWPTKLNKGTVVKYIVRHTYLINIIWLLIGILQIVSVCIQNSCSFRCLKYFLIIFNDAIIAITTMIRYLMKHNIIFLIYTFRFGELIWFYFFLNQFLYLQLSHRTGKIWSINECVTVLIRCTYAPWIY